jgi:glycine/sarcosine N-methyltransferase
LELLVPRMHDHYGHWARVYDYFYPDRTQEVEFWARLAGPYGRRLLDLMCGTAEVSLGLARHGYRVLGLDLSPAMLHVAAGRLAAAADFPARDLSLAQGDACALPIPGGSFDFAMVGGNGSFNHLADKAAVAALRELHRVLRPGGGLGMELVNPYLLKEIYPERTFGPFRPTPPGVWVEKRSANRYDHQAELFQIEQTTRYEIDGERGEFHESFALHVRQPGQIHELMGAAGFGEIRFYGGYGLEPFERWSSDLLVMAETSG